MSDMPNEPHRVDVHHHIIPAEYLSALAGIGVTKAAGLPFPSWDVNTTLSVMDRHGIRTAITSISTPGVHFGDRVFARDLARRCNEISAGLIRDHPDRFGAFGVVLLPDVDDALEETEYVLDTLELDGITLLANVGDCYLGDPSFDGLFDELNRRRAIVFIHPTVPLGASASNLTLPYPLVDFIFDTTRAIANLIFSGTLERCPDIRFIVSHAGGAAPYLAWRMSQFNRVQADVAEKAPQGALAYLKRLYYDTALSAAPYALSTLQALVDSSHILFGSDYPFAPEPVTEASVKGLNEYDGFDDETRRKVERENALTLFPRLGTLLAASGRIPTPNQHCP